MYKESRPDFRGFAQPKVLLIWGYADLQHGP